LILVKFLAGLIRDVNIVETIDDFEEENKVLNFMPIADGQ
jgi:hypothetical protein